MTYTLLQRTLAKIISLINILWHMQYELWLTHLYELYPIGDTELKLILKH